MPSRMAWVQRPSGLIKICKEAKVLKEDKLDLGR